jgi:hypothetical protein
VNNDPLMDNGLLVSVGVYQLKPIAIGISKSITVTVHQLASKVVFAEL